MKVNFNNEILPFCPETKYLGVTFDRSLTYYRHLKLLRKKLTSRIALLRGLAGSGWGPGATTLCTATLALVHSTAEYCAPIRCRSVHIRLIDDALRIVTGCLRITPVHNLTIPASIQPAERRRNRAMLYHAMPWSLDTCSTECKCTASQIETPICTHSTTTHQFIWQQRTCGTLECRVDGQRYKDPELHPRRWHPPTWNNPPKNSVGPA